MKLPDAPWRDREGLDALGQALGADRGEARFVGGAVRDTLIGIRVADVDMATIHRPDAILAMLADAGIRSVPTGLKHGTITAILGSGPIEVTTLRHDLETDGRHATVAFTDDWRADAARRDFTINALYADPLSGEVFDYFDGLGDLSQRRVRFIGDPLQRIAEDHLRILRFFRFLARFGDSPDESGLSACIARANDLMALSRERIADEMLKLLVARSAVAVVALMIEHQVLKPVLPEIDTSGVARLDLCVNREVEAGLAPDPIRRLAALLPRDPKTAENVGARLKLSNAQRRRLGHAAVDAAGSAEELTYRLGRESALDRLILTDMSDSEAAIRRIMDWPVPGFPLTGGALVARGIGKGPQVAQLLREIEDQWIAEGFPDKGRVEALADAKVDQALRSSRN
ncbi:CCA tRNA nucleotidyltransferase [Stakelama flava]